MFQQALVYVVFQVVLTNHTIGFTSVISQHPTEDEANEVINKAKQLEADRLQVYLDQHQVKDSKELYNLYISFIENNEEDMAAAIWSYFEDNSELSYKVVKAFVEDPTVITTKTLWFD